MSTTLNPPEEQRYAELQLMALGYARNGDTAALTSMLEAGLPANLADSQDQTLLMLACYYGHVDTARVLLQYGAEVDRRNARGQTPLGGASFKGYLEVARLLVAHGADLQADNGHGATPLALARMFGRVELAAWLVNQGAGVKASPRTPHPQDCLSAGPAQR